MRHETSGYHKPGVTKYIGTLEIILMPSNIPTQLLQLRDYFNGTPIRKITLPGIKYVFTNSKKKGYLSQVIKDSYFDQNIYPGTYCLFWQVSNNTC